MRILDRHLRNALLGVSIVVALALLGISGFITLVEELDDLGDGGYTLPWIGVVTLLKMPELLYEMFPLIVLLGAILGLGGLAAGGELVVMQAAGISVLRIAWSAGKSGLIFGVVIVLVGEFLVPVTRQMADDVYNQARFGANHISSRTVWLRQGDDYIRIGSLNNNAAVSGFRAMTLDRETHQLIRSVDIAEAQYAAGQWRADDIRTTEFSDGGVTLTRESSAPWDLQLDPELLQLFVLKSEGLSMRGLYSYIRYLDGNGLDATGPRYALWRKVAAPLTVLVMVFLAVPFVLGPLRDSGAGERLFIGVMIGIGFFVVNEVAGSLGQVYHWPAPMAALLPTALLAVVAYLRLNQVASR